MALPRVGALIIGPLMDSSMIGGECVITLRRRVQFLMHFWKCLVCMGCEPLFEWLRIPR